jgi:hypothetical protein
MHKESGLTLTILLAWQYGLAGYTFGEVHGAGEVE